MDRSKDRTLACNGKTWIFRYGNQAYRLFELQTKKPLGAVLQGDLANVGFAELTCLVWAGLKHYQPKATLEDVDEILDALGYEAVLNVAMDAINAAQPPKQDGAAPDETPLAGTNT